MTEDAEQMKIRGLKIIVTRKNIKIIDAYQINNVEKMEMILNEILDRSLTYFCKRPMKSLIREWKSHNRLYKLHILRKHTKDCDLSAKTNKFIEIVYFILGI